MGIFTAERLNNPYKIVPYEYSRARDIKFVVERSLKAHY